MKRPSQTRRRQDRKRRLRQDREWLSLANLPSRPTMDIHELSALTGDGLNTSYEKVRAGMFPAIRLGRRGKWAILTAPALEILRGERPPGPLPGGKLPASKAKRRKKVVAKKQKPKKATAPKIEATASEPAVAS